MQNRIWTRTIAFIKLVVITSIKRACRQQQNICLQTRLAISTARFFSCHDNRFQHGQDSKREIRLLVQLQQCDFMRKSNFNQRPQDRRDCTYREWRQFEDIYRGQPAPQTLLDHQTEPTSCPLSAPQLDPLNAIQIKFNK